MVEMRVESFNSNTGVAVFVVLRGTAEYRIELPAADALSPDESPRERVRRSLIALSETLREAIGAGAEIEWPPIG
jgi:hypothetical protein